VWHRAQHVTLGEEEGSGGHSEQWRLSSQVTLMRDGALLSWRRLSTCCCWEGVNAFPVLLYLLNCLYLSPQVFSLLPF